MGVARAAAGRMVARSITARWQATRLLVPPWHTNTCVAKTKDSQFGAGTTSMSPAMAAGIETKLWEMSDLLALVDAYWVAKKAKSSN